MFLYFMVFLNRAADVEVLAVKSKLTTATSGPTSLGAVPSLREAETSGRPSLLRKTLRAPDSSPTIPRRRFIGFRIY